MRALFILSFISLFSGKAFGQMDGMDMANTHIGLPTSKRAAYDLRDVIDADVNEVECNAFRVGRLTSEATLFLVMQVDGGISEATRPAGNWYRGPSNYMAIYQRGPRTKGGAYAYAFICGKELPFGSKITTLANQIINVEEEVLLDSDARCCPSGLRQHQYVLRNGTLVKLVK